MDQFSDSLYTIVPEQYNSRTFPSSLNCFCVYIRQNPIAVSIYRFYEKQ